MKRMPRNHCRNDPIPRRGKTERTDGKLVTSPYPEKNGVALSHPVVHFIQLPVARVS